MSLKKRLISIITMMAMVATVTSVTVFADETDQNQSILEPITVEDVGIETYSSSTTNTVKLKGTYKYTQAYKVLDKVNEERTAQGLSKLTMDKDLLSAAMKRAAEINLYFSHTRPSGKTCFTVSDKAYGENIAIGYTSASDVMNGWMNSSGHKKNIMGESYKSIGIGCFTQGGTLCWVQLFGTGSATKVSKPSDASKTVSVTINPSLFSGDMSLSATKTSIKTGKTASLTAYMTNPEWTYVKAKLVGSSLTWTSDKTSVAKVSSSGKVTGQGAGSASIKASTGSSGVTKSKTIKVSLATPTISKVSNVSDGVKVKWKKVTGASGYRVYRKTGKNGEYKKIATIKKGSTVSYTNKSTGSYKAQVGTKYYYKVKAYSGSATSSYSSSAKIIRLAKSKVTSAKNNSQKSITVKWEKKKSASGYQVQYGTKKDFSNAKKIKVTDAKTLKVKLESLKTGKTYYVRVRSYKKDGNDVYYGAYSDVKEVKIKK